MHIKTMQKFGAAICSVLSDPPHFRYRQTNLPWQFIENECEALPGVAYPGVRDNRSTINTKTGYDDDDDDETDVPLVMSFAVKNSHSLFKTAPLTWKKAMHG